MNYKVLFIKRGIYLFLLGSLFVLSANAQEKKAAIKVQEFESLDYSSENNFENLDKSEKDNGLENKISTQNFNKGASSSGDGSDIGTPADSPFNIGSDIQGNIEKSINEVTGKVNFGVPLASIQSGNVGYSVSLSYDGQSSMTVAKEINKYSPTSTIGVGWSLPQPKIVVDTKQTASRDDDVFYLADGAANSKLICINKQNDYWEFQLEKYAPWKIKYYLYDNNFEADYWTIIKSDGLKYYYGHPRVAQTGLPNAVGKSKEYVITRGNWIGDALTYQNAVEHTTVWNISRIEDQWESKLDFYYDKVEQSLPNLQKQTEASYLKEIVSSKGSKIELVYNNKTSYEYFEPHTEMIEPDAYQEQYEKKYLSNVKIFNKSNTLLTSYTLNHSLNGSLANTKRYLTGLTQISHKNGQQYNLPDQEFSYHLSGAFKGALKDVTYPSGGIVTYNYENKYMFSNNANRYVTSPNWSSDYIFYSNYVSDNYNLYVRRSKFPINGNKYRFKIYRYWWNGTQWESDEFIFPHLMEDSSTNRMSGFAAILKGDFYAFTFDTGSHADLYLFHKNKDGITWDQQTNTGLFISDDPYRLLAGNEFVAIARYETGRIDGFVWKGDHWSAGLPINQGGGQYYYAATNNFILSLNEDGGNDMITGASHQDNYYLHYLDAERNWQTKSWSASLDPYISGIVDPSYFYPSNALTAFVADNNPEFFLRWNSYYNITNVDNVMGSYNDLNPIQPIGGGFFNLHNFFYGMPYKSARFNGVNWDTSTLPTSSNYYAKLNFGEDIMTFQGHSGYSGVAYQKYDPNTGNFSTNSLNASGLIANSKSNGITKNYIIAGNKIFNRSTQGPPFTQFGQIGSLQYSNNFTYTDGLNHAFVKESQNGSFQQGSYFYINKENGLLNTIVNNEYHLAGYSKFGGNTPFMSPQSMWLRTESNNGSFSTFLYRIIDDKFNQSIYNPVVSSIEMDDKNNNIRKIEYSYSNPNSTPDNTSIFYGEVVKEHKGFGVNSNGKIKSVFNNGSTDLSLVGLKLEETILDVNNVLKQKSTKTYSKNIKSANNDKSNYITINTQRDEIYYDNDTVISEANFSYNSIGQLVSTDKTNSKGEIEKKEIRYAHEQYLYVKDKNMINDIYESTTKIDNNIVDVSRNIWINDLGKVYTKEKWSGPNVSELRLNNQITTIDNVGNVLEVNNGKNIYTSSLNGYSELYEVASVVNATHQDVVSELDVTYAQLQNLSTSNLKLELMKLYDRLPTAMISLTFYDDNGLITSVVNERREESFVFYDPYNRVDHITDEDGNVLEKKEYNFGN